MADIIAGKTLELELGSLGLNIGSAACVTFLREPQPCKPPCNKISKMERTSGHLVQSFGAVLPV